MTQSITTESGMVREKKLDRLEDRNGIPDSIACRTNIDGTLDFAPLPLAMRNIWLFNNGGERNDVY